MHYTFCLQEAGNKNWIWGIEILNFNLEKCRLRKYQKLENICIKIWVVQFDPYSNCY